MPKYGLSPDGRILADNQTIGHLHGDHGDYTLDIKLATSAENTVKALIFDRIRSKPPEGKTLIEVFANEERVEERAIPVPQEPGASDLDSRDDLVTIPPTSPPPMDPKFGDKTPAYVQWFAEHFPEKYREKYKGRRTHLTGGMNPHLSPSGDVPDHHFGQEATEVWMKKR